MMYPSGTYPPPSAFGQMAAADDAHAKPLNQPAKRPASADDPENPTAYRVACEWFKVAMLLFLVLIVAASMYLFYWHFHVVYDDVYAREHNARHQAADLLKHYCNGVREAPGADGQSRHINSDVCIQAERLLASSFELNVLHSVAREIVHHIPFLGECLVGSAWCMVGFVYYMEAIRSAWFWVALVMVAGLGIAYLLFTARTARKAVDMLSKRRSGTKLPTRVATTASTATHSAVPDYMGTADYNTHAAIGHAVTMLYDPAKAKTS